MSDSNLTTGEETALLERLRQDDERAFRSLYDQYYKYLVVTAYRYLQDGEKAKDFAQDTFVELWNRRKNLVITTQLKGYLRQVVVNKSLTYLKREKRLDFAETQDLPETAIVATAPQNLEKQDLETSLQKAIERLPERCRIIFCMSRFEEKSHKEIAAELGISTKTIENQMTRALKVLRKVVQRIDIYILGIGMKFSFLNGGDLITIVGDFLFLMVL